MNSKIKEIIKITFYNTLILLVFFGFRYFLDYYDLLNKLGNSHIWIYLLIGVILVTATGTFGVIENRGESLSELRKSNNLTSIKKLIVGFAYWGIRIPLIIGVFSIWLFNFSSSVYILLLYICFGVAYSILSVLSKKEQLQD